MRFIISSCEAAHKDGGLEIEGMTIDLHKGEREDAAALLSRIPPENAGDFAICY